MAIITPVVDGDLLPPTNQTTSGAKGNSMDKDSFLQLLVAQMKYQDPLEPTSNTEYISQYATFSELEQMQNLSNSMDMQRASALVGKNVYVKTTNSITGETGYVYGRVDYVQMENNKALLSIKGNLYSIDDLESVVDPYYEESQDAGIEFVDRLRNLPNEEQIGLGNKEEVDALEKIYKEMNKYQKEFIGADAVKLLESYVSKIKDLDAAATKTAADMEERLKKLPGVENITLDNKKEIEALSEIYNGMNKHQQKYVKEEDAKLLESYAAKLKELEKPAEGGEEEGETTA